MLSPLAYALLLLAALKCSSTLLRVDATTSSLSSNTTTTATINIIDNGSSIDNNGTYVTTTRTTPNASSVEREASTTVRSISINEALGTAAAGAIFNNISTPTTAHQHDASVPINATAALATEGPPAAADGDDNGVVEMLPVAQPLVAGPPEPPLHGPAGGRLPEFPQRPDAVYFVVAVTGGAKIWSRTLARTLIDMGSPFASPQGPPLRPLYVDIPPNGR